MSEKVQVQTQIGRAGWLDHRYRGHALYGDLLGHETLLGLIALGLTGHRLAADDVARLDHLAIVLAIPDPHIWPIKLVRVASSYGGSLPGVACGLLAMHRARLGSWTTQDAGGVLIQLRTAPDMEARIDALIASGIKIPGFGVPGRPKDERVAAIIERLCPQSDEGSWWSLFVRAAGHAERTHGLKANIGSALAALLLDMGFELHHLGMMASVLLLGSFVPNAAEGAEQASPLLQSLPADRVHYVGPPARPSPRQSALSR